MKQLLCWLSACFTVLRFEPLLPSVVLVYNQKVGCVFRELGAFK